MTAIEIVVGDITALEVEAVVCPAHKYLIKGRGLSAQLFEKAGPQLAEECSRIDKKCAVGEAAVTQAYNLKADYILHTVTPQWSSGDQWGSEALKQLRKCYESVVQLAVERGIKSIAFPALGAGTNRTPQSIASHQGLDILHKNRQSFDKLIVCLRSEATQQIWLDTFKTFEQEDSR